ncbi:MAG TPA: hypothetical protein VMF55_09435 [Solirubrobacterales bacterium]|nr:hypothetical protein [Solirubrobacterales bacterium]
MLPLGASVVLLVVHALSAAIWIGGLVAIFVVARAASATLEPAQRVAFFRSLGRTYGLVGTAALLLALASGALLLHDHPWDGLLIATAIVAAALLLALGAGMAQARAMTRLRRRALAQPGDVGLDRRVHRGATLATFLRATIGLLTLTLVVLGACLVD